MIIENYLNKLSNLRKIVALIDILPTLTTPPLTNHFYACQSCAETRNHDEKLQPTRTSHEKSLIILC
jgi:hypothetical protein